jgi:putative mRNA 3-end processing factor
MKVPNDALPKSNNEQVRSLFKVGLAAAEAISSGTKPSKDDGAFGEGIEYLAFELTKRAGGQLDEFKTVNVVDERLGAIFLDSLGEVTPDLAIQSLILGTYGYLVGNYSDEEYRYLYRYILHEGRQHDDYRDWLLNSLALIAAWTKNSAEEVLKEIRYWIRFLGTPLYSPTEFVDACFKYAVDIQPVLDSDKMRVVLSLRAHPEYLMEAVQGRRFDELYNQYAEWLPDELLTKVFVMAQNAAYRELQTSIADDTPVLKAISIAERVFQKTGFRVDHRTGIPVKLQLLSNPPPPEAINPVIFEMIPQKLRMTLMTSVAYSSKPHEIEIVFLGGPRIGRSGILIKTNTGGVLLDYGLSVANQQIPEWVPELETIDTILISHAHLDHVGGLPALYDRFEGKWCSSGPSGAITMALLDDALKVGTPELPRKHDRLDRISLFNQTNIDKVGRNHVKLEIGETSEVAPGILVTPIDACHIPGSAAYLIDIEGKRILYTGDFNLDQSVLFPGATLPTDADIIAFDGTYWAREDFNRARVTEQLSEVIHKFGPVIIPSFAVGRTQEVLSTLEGLGITKNRNVIVAGMAETVTKMVGQSGHWVGLKKNKVDLEEEDVLVAGGGMMAGGLARYHFGQHRENPKAAVVLCGYLAPRTPGWNLLHEYEPHQCHVEYARLSAHSSSSRLMDYVRSCKGKRIMVHTPVAEAPDGVIIPELNQRIKIEI